MIGRLLVVLILALAVGLYFPESRARLHERAQPLLNPSLGWFTNQELKQIVADLDEIQDSRRGLPTQRGEFDAWLDDRYMQEPSRVDNWGTRYRLEVTSTRFEVVSAGPDRIFGTPDDLSVGAERLGPSRRR